MSATSTGRRAGPAGLWLRWSWRDLRARWLQVAAIALVIALGTGSYAGLSSVTQWRRISTDDAYGALQMYDLRVEVAESGLVPAGTLLAAIQSIDDASLVTGANERLLADIQVDASTDDVTVFVPGGLQGMETGGVNDIYASRGRTWTEEERGEPVVLIERNFARHYRLPDAGRLRLGGGVEFDYIGHALAPEFFLVTTEQGGMLAEANYAAVFTSLETAQSLLNQPGMVNDAVLTLAAGADRDAILAQLETTLAQLDVGAEVVTRDEDPSYRLNDNDIKGDQQMYNVFAVLIFAGAVVAAFNLTSRIMDAQRREIGIAMALGVPPMRIAIRPLLMGIEIATLGVLLGAIVGYLLGAVMMILVRDLMPLPEWNTPFRWRIFAGAAFLGFLLPVIATAWPVWRSVSVAPVNAMKPAYRMSRGGGPARIVRMLRLPGRTFMRIPVRNLVRAPRRTLLTVLGISASLAALVAFIGMIDSFLVTTERGDKEILGNTPNRLEVTLDSYYPPESPVVLDLTGSPLFASAEVGARLGGVLLNGDEEIDIQLDLLDMTSDIWQPTITEGTRSRTTPGLYISEEAARDLNVDVGDTVVMRHPRVDAFGQVTLAETEVPVLGTHPHPFRFVTYMDVNHAALFAPVPLANLLRAVPAEDVSDDEIRRSLFEMEGVSSVQSVGAVAESIKDLLNEFVVVLRVVEGAMLLIALLIAFNSSSINMEERTREHATMFAFGVPIRTVMGMVILENLMLGIISTAVGLGAGWLLLNVLMETRIATTMPDISMTVALSASTVAITVFFGVMMVALAPLLNGPRLLSMDIPAKLKVME